MTADKEDFVLTELNCPCGEIETLEHCSAARYEESELPCLPEEAAGVRCYNGRQLMLSTYALLFFRHNLVAVIAINLSSYLFFIPLSVLKCSLKTPIKWENLYDLP